MDSLSSVSSFVAAASSGGEKAKMNMAVIGQQLRMQRETVTTLVGSAVKAGATTPTRGQNVNTVA